MVCALTYLVVLICTLAYGQGFAGPNTQKDV